jgi:hypothetical protein
VKADIFDAIAVYVPEDHRPEYWRVVARFRHLKPDDEILNIFLAMGILTFLLRDLPAALIEEKKSWKTQLDLFRTEMNRMVDEATRQVITVNNQTEVVTKVIEKGSVLFNDSALRLEKASQEVIQQIDLDAMAQRLTAKVEERVLKPLNIVALQSENQLRVMERVGKSAEASITMLRRIHLGAVAAAASVAAFVVWGSLFGLGWHEMKKANEAALNDKLAEIQNLALTNQDAFLQLTTDHIKVEIVDVKTNGETEIGKKALRLTPALGTNEETPDGQPKAGIIYFPVPETSLDQLLRTLRGY